MSKSAFNFERFFDLTTDLICIANFDGYFERVNQAVSKALGYSFEELYSRPIDDFIHPDDRSVTAAARGELSKIKSLHNFENRYITKKGKIIWLSWTSIPCQDDKVVFAIAKDITHQKRIEAERNIQFTELSISNKYYEQINYKTSHDLRSPVNNLNALLDLIHLDEIQGAKNKDVIAMLKKGALQLKETMNQYIESLIDNIEPTVKIESIHFNKHLDTVLESINNLISTSHTQVIANFDHAPIAHFNNEYIESIFLNLITNSIKYKQQAVTPKIKIDTANIASKVVLVYEDNGIGFDMEKVKDRIFGLRQTFHNNEDSKGIGLYLVHSHITSLGGDITVESEVNKGTKYTITFPVNTQNTF